MKISLFIFLFFISVYVSGQDIANPNPSEPQTQLKVQELVSKKAEYHRLTNGERDGYRIKIHFGIDRDAAEAVRIKFSTRFPEYPTDKEYEQPHFVVLVGDYKTRLEAFESWKKIKSEFPSAFIVKGKIKITR